MRVSYKTIVAGAVGLACLVSSYVAYPQAAPNRALSTPGSNIQTMQYPGNMTSITHWASVPGNLPNWPSGANCSEALQKEKELTALLKKKIELLEQQVAQVGTAGVSKK